MQAGLRIDVDTYRGTREGVPRLLESLDEAGVKATFFFSVGPDNTGAPLVAPDPPRNSCGRCCVPTLPACMAGISLLAGTAWPGKPIGRDLGT